MSRTDGIDHLSADLLRDLPKKMRMRTFMAVQTSGVVA